ncbi:MAG: hypothetical protein WA702_16735, partial [Bradyrhizobium sp.]|uniref:hypothetical protein n=1 Tax=Bradyrhizobium sp. TaxID=376 RepID=UPI003C7B10A4
MANLNGQLEVRARRLDFRSPAPTVAGWSARLNRKISRRLGHQYKKLFANLAPTGKAQIYGTVVKVEIPVNRASS